MEKILICLYAYYPFANANTNVMMPFINSLKEHYSISIATMNYNKKAKEHEIVEGIEIYRYNRPNKLMRYIYAIESGDVKLINSFRKLSFLLLYPISKIITHFTCFQHPEYRIIKQLVKQNEYSLVLSTCEYHLSNIHVLRLKKEKKYNGKWITYFMDPHAFFIGNLRCSKMQIKKECEVYEKADLNLVTDEIYRENKQNVLSSYIYKTYPVPYGNFRISDTIDVTSPLIKDKVNFVFAGSMLDMSIRDPSFFYSMINNAPIEYFFHIITRNMSKENYELRDKLLKSKNVKWYYDLPLVESLAFINRADILVNLGNKSINQTPSKIFDYIGTGKPIVNFHSLEHDTAKKYLVDYPNCINIMEDSNCLMEAEKQLEKFVCGHLHVHVDRSSLINTYGCYLPTQTVPVVVCKIMEVINC